MRPNDVLYLIPYMLITMIVMLLRTKERPLVSIMNIYWNHFNRYSNKLKLRTTNYPQYHPRAQNTETSGLDDNLLSNVFATQLHTKLAANKTPTERFDFKLVTAPNDKCTRIEHAFHRPIDLLILIKSATHNFAQRNAIRVTWGAERCWDQRLVARIFLLGNVADHNADTMEHIAYEAAQYGDIVQQDFTDHYYNNTYKIMLGINWALRFCASVPVLMFVDDDFFVHAKNVLDYLDGLTDAAYQSLFAGRLWPQAIPVRDPDDQDYGKWFVRPDEYSEEFYPPYVSAGHFFVSITVAAELSVMAQYTRYFRFDDVYLGILMHKLNHTLTHLEGIYTSTTVSRFSKHFYIMLSSHGFATPDAQMAAWQMIKGYEYCR